MKTIVTVGCALAAAFAFSPVAAQDAKPEMRLQQTVEGMPKGEKQQVMVLTATLKPGDKTPFHTHRFPVTAHILEGHVHPRNRWTPTGRPEGGRLIRRAAECQDDRI
jgi:hypothetical protein